MNGTLTHLVAAFAALCILLPSLLFLFEAIGGVFCRSSGVDKAVESVLPGRRVVIVMPAHNEAGGIEGTVRDLLPQLDADVSLLVVADNCSDETCRIVCAFAERYPHIAVIERHDAVRRGKGYALNHGIEHLRTNPPEFVMILDADCKVSEGGVVTLVAECHRLGRPIQALDLMQNQRRDIGVALKLAEFAWVVKNQVRALGARALGLPCPLMGTGMVFGWEQISTVQLATGHLAEDMQLGVNFAIAGKPAAFCNAAMVTSEFPVTDEGQQAQRTRWEHGHLNVILTEAPKLLLHGFKNWDAKLLLTALDVSIPPLALLSMLAGASFCASFSLWLWQGHVGALYLSGLAILSILAGVGFAWVGFGRHIITLRELVFIPLYVIRKIPLYVFFLFRRQTAWVRSKREGEE